MALRDFWRGYRERYGEDRDRDRWRSGGEDWRSGEDWRDEGRYGRERGGVYGASEREYSGAGQRYGESNWSPGSEYYADYYGGRDYSQPYGHGERRWGSGEHPREEDRRYGLDYGRSYGRGGRSGYGASRETGASEYSTGQYRGRGPRGYQRSDERIREDVCDQLTDDPNIDASNLEVTVKNGEVTLSGTVNSRDDKRRVEECAEDISGVKDVHNMLHVSTEQRSVEQSAGQQTARH